MPFKRILALLRRCPEQADGGGYGHTRLRGIVLARCGGCKA